MGQRDPVPPPSPSPTPSLTMWTIYDHPLDYPRHFVVRQFLILPGRPEPLGAYVACLYDTLNEARYDCFLRGGTIQFERSPDDDRFIIETWMP